MAARAVRGAVGGSSETSGPNRSENKTAAPIQGPLQEDVDFSKLFKTQEFVGNIVSLEIKRKRRLRGS